MHLVHISFHMMKLVVMLSYQNRMTVSDTDDIVAGVTKMTNPCKIYLHQGA